MACYVAQELLHLICLAQYLLSPDCTMMPFLLQSRTSSQLLFMSSARYTISVMVFGFSWGFVCVAISATAGFSGPILWVVVSIAQHSLVLLHSLPLCPYSARELLFKVFCCHPGRWGLLLLVFSFSSHGQPLLWQPWNRPLASLLQAALPLIELFPFFVYGPHILCN